MITGIACVDPIFDKEAKVHAHSCHDCQHCECVEYREEQVFASLLDEVRVNVVASEYQREQVDHEATKLDHIQ